MHMPVNNVVRHYWDPPTILRLVPLTLAPHAKISNHMVHVHCTTYNCTSIALLHVRSIFACDLNGALLVLTENGEFFYTFLSFTFRWHISLHVVSSCIIACRVQNLCFIFICFHVCHETSLALQDECMHDSTKIAQIVADSQIFNKVCKVIFGFVDF